MVSRCITQMKRYGLPVCFLFAASVAPALGANIVATVDRNEVGVNETFRLTIEADDTTEAPDFSVLQESFEILDQSQNQNISIINGQTSRKFVWDVVLTAPREGVFQIPSIDFGADSSQPITIVVKPESEIKQEDKTAYLDVDTDVEQLYVQQQVIFTVQIFRSVEIASATLSDLEVEGVDAIVERFGDDKSYQIMRNGRRWLVVERRYLVFPQQSGLMTIKPLQFRGRIVPRRSSLGFGMLNQQAGKPVVLRSDSITLGVREPPPSFAGPWLPAKRLELTESWPRNRKLTVGEPITRKITLQALGLTAAQLPELDLALPQGLRNYPEQPTIENKGHAEGVQGKREEAVAIIPTRPGTLTLPEVQVAWWNVDAQQPEIATLPARTIEVMPAASQELMPSAITAAPGPGSTRETAEHNPGSFKVIQSGNWWRWASLGLGIAWVFTLGMWMVDRRRSARRSKPPEQVRPGRGPGKALRELRNACDAKDAPAAKDALLGWGAVHWPDAPPANLAQLGARCGEPMMLHLRELEQALYGHGTDWDPASLLEAVRVYKLRKEAQRGPTPLSLEPMYRA